VTSPQIQEPVRIGVIGIGAISTKYHIPEFGALPGARLQAFAARNASAIRSAADQYRVPDVYDGPNGWRHLIANPAVDAVLISSPSALHAEMAVAAARAGKHLLVEKPLATTVADGRQVVAAARQAGVHGFIAHHRRMRPVYREGRRLLEAGTVGRVYRVDATLGHAGPEFWAPRAAWFFDPALAGGGAVLDLGIHMADLVLWLLGRRPASVTGFVSTVEKPTSLDDQGTAVLRFDDGCLVVLTVNWAMRPGVRRVEIVGSQGRLSLDEIADEGVVLERLLPEPLTQRTRLAPPPTNPAGLPTNGCAAAFVAALRGEQTALATLEEGLWALAVVEAWYRAARRGGIDLKSVHDGTPTA
jgi:UDP-N-acetylglucosamine 3-dehydrogenase